VIRYINVTNDNLSGPSPDTQGRKEPTQDTQRHLAIYLNDHLAGSTTLINLLEHLQRTRPGKDLEWFLVTLRGDVVADRVSLEGIMQRAQVEKHRRRSGAAWLMEKLSRMKLHAEDSGDGSLHLLEGLELVEAGIEGKRELWRSLAVNADHLAALKGIDFEPLIQRAQDQHERVEAVRLETAKRALASVDGEPLKKAA